MDDAGIHNDEALANYIFDSNKIRSDAVHHRALMPARDGTRSVFRVSGLPLAEVAALGNEHVAAERGRPLIGWATILAANVRSIGLHLRIEEPPPRHAVIENWPAEVEAQRTLAMQLASRATAQKWPPEAEQAR